MSEWGVMALIWFTLVFVVVVIDRLEDWNFRHVHSKVSQRWASGDRSCTMRKTWYGWRVHEYPECDQ